MDLKSVPVGQKAVVADTSYIKAIFERTDQSTGILDQYDPSTGMLVLKVTYHLNSNKIDIHYADPKFWTFKADGVTVRPPLSFSYLQVDIDPPSRTINFKTK